jgi:hypothetical protein
VEGLGGDLGMNSDWGANASRGETASFATVLGGGADTRLSKRFDYRVSGGFVYENIALEQPKPINTPYRIPGSQLLRTGLNWPGLRFQQTRRALPADSPGASSGLAWRI